MRERIGSYPGLVSTLTEEFAGRRTAEIRHRITAIGVQKRRVFILSRSVHPAGRFSYEMRLQRQSPANGVYAHFMNDPGRVTCA